MAVAAKNKADKKAPTAKKETVKAEKVAKVSGDGVELIATNRITILKATKNPSRVGTKAYEMFEATRGHKRVQDALDAGVSRAYLKFWIANELIKVG